MNRRSIAGTCFLWLTLLTCLMAGSAVPNPKVIGPIPPTALPGDPSHGYPFFSVAEDLKRRGYVEEGFFLEGTANRYNTPPLATATVINRGHPYGTRMVVRRPLSAAKFNGTVLLKWQNVTGGYDLDAMSATTQEHLIRKGFGWIGVSAQRAGVHDPTSGLKAWSPSRDGTLDLTQDGAIQDDPLCYDVFSQAAQAVRSPSGVDPTGGLRVGRVFAIGASQSASRLVSYYNSVHPLAGVLDGVILVVGGGRLRTDLGVKVYQLLSETDVARGVVRQTDSDHFRRWEVAGTAHLDFQVWQRVVNLKARDHVVSTLNVCDLPSFSRIPFSFAANAAIDHLVRWEGTTFRRPRLPRFNLLRSTRPRSRETTTATRRAVSACRSMRSPRLPIPAPIRARGSAASTALSSRLTTRPSASGIPIGRRTFCR